MKKRFIFLLALGLIWLGKSIVAIEFTASFAYSQQEEEGAEKEPSALGVTQREAIVEKQSERKVIRDSVSYYEREGIGLLRSKKFSEAIEKLEYAADRREQLGNTPDAVMLVTKIGLAYDAQGDHENALKSFRRTLRICEKAKDMLGVADANANIGQVYRAIGDYKKAHEHLKRAKKLYDRYGKTNKMSETAKAKKLHELHEETDETCDLDRTSRWSETGSLDVLVERLGKLVEEKERARRSTRRIVVTTFFALLLCLLIYRHLKPNARYERAHSLLTGEEYSKAIPLYSKLALTHSHKDVVKKARKELLWDIFLLRDTKISDGPPPSTELIAAALEDEDSIVRGSAVKILGETGCNDVAIFANIYNGDGDQWVRDCAELELMNVGFRMVEATDDFSMDFEKWWTAHVRSSQRPDDEESGRQTVNPMTRARPCMAHVPAGEFLIGDDKRPCHVDAFCIDKYPITNSQYRAFLEATGHDEPKYWRDERFGKDSHPAVGISFDDALAYAEWIGKRLPTKEEWEKAARGTHGRQWPWGNDFGASRCNTRESGVLHTTPVGIYPRGVSPYGCYDVAGNVAEWIYSDSVGLIKMIRGGYWNADQMLARCASSVNIARNHRSVSVGLRCAFDA